MMVQRRLFRLACKTCRNRRLNQVSQSQSFSSTAQRAKILPSFQPTSSPELDSLLLTFRKHVFTPSALSEAHRKLIYRPSQHPILLNEPGVTVTLSNNEEIKLEPMNRHGQPRKRESLLKLLALMQSAGDWKNLPPFLEGMQQAHSKLPDSWLEKVVRHANEHDKLGVIIRCAEMVEKTGLSLASQRLTEELMLGFHMNAVKARWQGEQMEKACKQAEQVALIMEFKSHCGGKLKAGMTDMRRSFMVVGVLLELSAARVLHSSEAVEHEKDKVKSYAAKALALPTNLSLGKSAVTRVQMERWIPLWNGLKMAMKIDEVSQSGLAEKLRNMISNLEGSINKARTTLIDEAKGRPRRPLIMYEDLGAQ